LSFAFLLHITSNNIKLILFITETRACNIICKFKILKNLFSYLFRKSFIYLKHFTVITYSINNMLITFLLFLHLYCYFENNQTCAICIKIFCVFLQNLYANFIYLANWKLRYSLWGHFRFQYHFFPQIIRVFYECPLFRESRRFTMSK